MASIELIKASDGSGNASVATVTNTRAPSATTILVDTVLGINTTFMASMGTPHTFVDPITAETITVISEDTCVDFSGHVDGSNLEIDTIAPGYTDLGSVSGDIVIIRPTTQWADNVAGVLANQHNDDGTHSDITADSATVSGETILIGALTVKSWDGWIKPTDTWTYASATTFIIAGVDRTSQFPVGTRIKLTQTTAKYFYVTASAFGTDTTVTITGGSDYSLANAAITSPSLSYMTTPQGFPGWFNWVPSYGGLTIGNGTVKARFSMVGKTIKYYFSFVLGTTSAVAASATITAPVTASSDYIVTAVSIGTATFIDNSTSANNSFGYARLESTTVIRPIALGAAATYLTQSGVTNLIPFTWANLDSLMHEGSYESA